MFSQFRPALTAFFILTLLTGVVYPLVVTGAAQLIFPRQANGSLIKKDGQIVGSALIGQAFDNPQYFWGRPSATGYSSLPSSGSNLGPTSQALLEQVQQQALILREQFNLPAGAPLPADLLFASGSGLDPHISPAAARLQIERVAQARGLSFEQVSTLVEQFIEPAQFGVLGQPRVNVLLLNLALDGLK